MTQPSHPETEATGEPKKRSYEPPRILSREPLEAVAAVCRGGTSKGNPINCPSGPIAS